MKLALEVDAKLRGLHCQADSARGVVTESPLARTWFGRLVRIAHEVEHCLTGKNDAQLHHPQRHWCGLAPYSAPGPLGRRHLSKRSLLLAGWLIREGVVDTEAVP